MAAQSKMSGHPQFISYRLSGRPLQGHPHSRAPLGDGEFTHWFENEVSLQVSDVNFMVTIPMSKLIGWTAKAREYMVAIYSKLTGHDDCILVRCNKLPRVFIAPRQFFDAQAKYLDVSGELPIIVDEDSAVCSNFNTIPDNEFASTQVDQISDGIVAEAVQLGSEAAPGAPVVESSNDGNGPSAPLAHPARVGRNGVPRPPNCFILFRQHLHPLVVRDNPGVHNNEISAIISKMWHAAPAIVIEQYRDLAKDAKAAHRLLHPTYNYRPRRSFEKKRRMSKKKATALKAIAATTTAAAQANQQLARPNSALNAVPTSSTSGDFIDFNISTENSSIELQGSGLSLKLVDNNAAVQVKDSGAASGGFVPREDGKLHDESQMFLWVLLEEKFLVTMAALAEAMLTIEKTRAKLLEFKQQEHGPVIKMRQPYSDIILPTPITYPMPDFLPDKLHGKHPWNNWLDNSAQSPAGWVAIQQKIPKVGEKLMRKIVLLYEVVQEEFDEDADPNLSPEYSNEIPAPGDAFRHMTWSGFCTVPSFKLGFESGNRKLHGLDGTATMEYFSKTLCSLYDGVGVRLGTDNCPYFRFAMAYEKH
ncbi:hypothetical protein IFR05_009067 [Cadophora sp. M221]|nr:hypothetical protein IFR05_009067 [Cadophora sp. M221]